MPELSPGDIEIISNDVRREHISFSHLREDLIDHICCDVESEMVSGLSFGDAYARVRLRIGPDRLRELQQETLFTVDKKYRKMKTLMKISGIAGTFLFGISALFKIQHWPGAGIMLTAGAFILALVFMPAAISVLWKETRSKNKLLLFVSVFLATMFFILGTLFKVQHWPYAGLLLLLALVSAGLVLIPSLLTWLLSDPERRSRLPVYLTASVGAICLMTGVLFKFQHWPASGILLMAGLLMLVFIALPWYTVLKWRNESRVDVKFIYIVIALAGVLLPVTLVNINLQRSYEEGFYPHLEQQEKLHEWLINNNNRILSTYSDSACHDKMMNVHLMATDIQNQISVIQQKMVSLSENIPGRPSVDPWQVKKTDLGNTIYYRSLSSPFNIEVPKIILGDESPERVRLEKLLEDYSKTIAGNNLNDGASPAIVDPASCLPVFSEGSEPVSMLTALHSLLVLGNSVLSIEAHEFDELASANLKK
ncbi:MAG: hypothetical protein U0X39_13790 [Bacteroidales bacterium]